MPIQLNISNHLQPLTDKLSNDLQQHNDDPFAPQWVVTQTEGMNSWLRIALAQRLGIAANLKFQKPTDIVSYLYLLTDRGLHKTLDKETVRWILFALLNDTDFQAEYPEIAAYYVGNPIQQIALAGELADIFDQYQVYRQEIITGWNGTQTPDDDTRWQARLWKNLKARLGDTYHDRTQVADLILEQIKESRTRSQIIGRIPRLYFFGIAVITPYYIRILEQLAGFMDIHFYLLNPAPSTYWLEDRSEQQIARLCNRKRTKPEAGNDLLHNWGRIIRESFGLLFKNDDFINSYDDQFARPIEKPITLLQKIQHDIYNNANKDNRQPLQEADIADGSITINGCFTPLREVETLYNYLVHHVDKSEDAVSPREMLVLVTDIDLYAPFIKAVFNHSPYPFPITIADEAITADNNMFTALQDILNLDPHPFKAEQVMQLLESPYVRSRFQIRDTDMLRSAVRNAGIIFGQEGRREDDTRFVSWAYGLKRILFGICMSGEREYDDGVDTFIPLDNDEGSSALERVKLIHFIEVLQYQLNQRQDPRTITGWAQYLTEVMENLIFQAGEKEDEDYARFIRIIEQLTLLDTGDELKVSFEVFRHSFLHLLQQEARLGAFASKGITFCSMVPMRSIPFKVVALLGMDFDKFPRKDSPLSFSLLSKKREPGDRNVKDNDKHLFLETFISAGEKLYMSYLARSVKDGTKLPPSSLVDECIDYVARGIGMDTDELREKWVTIHPLHGFNRRYFEPGQLTNYLSESRYATRIEVSITGAEQTKQKDFSEIDIQDLARFFENTPKVYLNRQLDIYYQDEEILLPDHEPFELAGLDKWKVQNDLLLANEDVLDPFIREKRRAGEIPLRNMGDALVRATYQEGEELRQLLLDEIGGETMQTIEVQLSVDGSTVKGSIDAIYADRLVTFSHSKSKMLARLMSAYVKYLALTAAGHQLHWIFAWKGEDEILKARVHAGTVSAAEAMMQLQEIVKGYKAGHADFFPFWAAMAAKKFNILTNPDVEGLLEDVQDKQESTFDYSYNDPYFEKAIELGFIAEDRYDALREHMHKLMGPIVDIMPQPFD